MSSIDYTTIEGNINYEICLTIANLFEHAALLKYDMEQFANVYLNSRLCNFSIDSCWSLYQYNTAKENLYWLIEEVGNVFKPDFDYDPEEARWTGFTYKQLQFETELPSTELIKILPYSTLSLYYYAGHTYKEEYATDIICEIYGLHKVP